MNQLELFPLSRLELELQQARRIRRAAQIRYFVNRRLMQCTDVN